jgi:uncharacterized protein (TIGR00255 family)
MRINMPERGFGNIAMTTSMTAFARHSGDGDWGRATWELRSVNHRYLEISLRLPEELRGLETAVRERIDKHLKRGKLDCMLRFEASTTVAPQLSVNFELARQLVEACTRINAMTQQSAGVNATDILRWPGVIATESQNMDAVSEAVLALLDDTLRVLVEMREREGAKLRALLEQRCTEARARVAQLRAQLPAIIDSVRTRWLTRIQEMLQASAALDPGRLEQETALLMQKLDVAEELDRLDTHIEEVLRVLHKERVAGRRLDFLMQEMHREANTLGAKSAHIDTTGASVDLKVLIEQMREQVQNIE